MSLCLELIVDAAPSVGAVVGFEDGTSQLPRSSISVSGSDGRELVLVARLGHVECREKLAQSPFGTQRLNQQSLSLFVSSFAGSVPAPFPRISRAPSKTSHLSSSRRSSFSSSAFLASRAPISACVTGTDLIGDPLHAPVSSDKRCRGSLLLFEGERPGLGGPPLARRQLVYPLSELFRASGVSQPASRVGVAAAVLQIMTDGARLLLF